MLTSFPSTIYFPLSTGLNLSSASLQGQLGRHSYLTTLINPNMCFFLALVDETKYVNGPESIQIVRDRSKLWALCSCDNSALLLPSKSAMQDLLSRSHCERQWHLFSS